jgi:hypothetical protein
MRTIFNLIIVGLGLLLTIPMMILIVAYQQARENLDTVSTEWGDKPKSQSFKDKLKEYAENRK